MLEINMTAKVSLKHEIFKSILSLSGKLFANKAWELEVMYYSPELISFIFSITRKCDHAGVVLEVGVFGLSAAFRVYDTRHWSVYKNDWTL